MLRPGAQNDFITQRVNMPTNMSHAQIVSIDAKLKARSFFSARVAEAHVLEKLREVSDAYSRGEMGLGEARNILKDWLRENNAEGSGKGLRKLASTARLNLILDQNARMARAAGEWQRMHEPTQMQMFPYVRYHSRSDNRARDAHRHLDGNIYRKDDPFLKTHTPPWEFNCRCWLEELTAKQAGRDAEKIQEPTPPEKVHVESESGFEFDPEKVFDENKLPNLSVETRRQMLSSIRKCVNETGTKFVIAPNKNTHTMQTVSGLPDKTAINVFIQQNQPILDDPKSPKEHPELRDAPKSLPMGILSKEISEAFALNPGEDKVLLSRGDRQFGLFHQIGEHKPEMLDGRMIQAIMETLGSKNVKYTLCMQSGKNNYINVESIDGSGYLTLLQRGIDRHWEIVSAHCRASEEYKNKYNRV